MDLELITRALVISNNLVLWIYKGKVYELL